MRDNSRAILPLGLGRDHGVLGGLCQPELHRRPGRDIDRLARGRVSPHPGRTLGLHELAQSRNRELALLAGLGRGGLNLEITERYNLLRWSFHLLGHVQDQRRLGHLLHRSLRPGRSLGGGYLLRHDLGRRLFSCYLLGCQ